MFGFFLPTNLFLEIRPPVSSRFPLQGGFTSYGRSKWIRRFQVTVTNRFTVGDGISGATLSLLGGTHSFSNGLHIATNAFLIGTGTNIADVLNDGTVSPGQLPGALFHACGFLRRGSALNR